MDSAMKHARTLGRLCPLKHNRNWTALLFPGRAWLSSYGTNRVGNLKGGKLFFTIGETEHGKASRLSQWIGASIVSHGLTVHRVRSTNGARKNHVYFGFDLATASATTVKKIVSSVLEEVQARC
jgi:hypothetical protein